MHALEIDREKCTGCGLCVGDCSPKVLLLEDGHPACTPRWSAWCIGCQHCLAVCPRGALSIQGKNPADSIPLKGLQPDPRQIAALLKGRRSIRRYRDENLDPELIRQLIEVASYSPSGSNSRKVRFTLIDRKETMARFRSEAMAGLRRLADGPGFPAGLEYFGWYADVWEQQQRDILLRGAPHLVIASAPKSCQTPLQDSIIALAWFEFHAHSLGIGTLWDGVATTAIDRLVPELRERLGIPPDHLIGETMIFGKPAVRYARTVQYPPNEIHTLRYS